MAVFLLSLAVCSRDDKENAVDLLAMTALVEALECAKEVEAEKAAQGESVAQEEGEDGGEDGSGTAQGTSLFPLAPSSLDDEEGEQTGDATQDDAAAARERRNIIARDAHGKVMQWSYECACIYLVLHDAQAIWPLCTCPRSLTCLLQLLLWCRITLRYGVALPVLVQSPAHLHTLYCVGRCGGCMRV